MNKAFAFLFFAVVGLTLSQSGAQPASPGAGAPTTQQLQSLLDAKQYPQVIQQSQRLLSLKGAAANDVDKYEVQMLRAEAYLQQKQQGQATASYQAAIKETKDPTKAGLPKAMVMLLQKSKAMMYTPKPSKDPTHPAAPLNIVDPAERKMALQALFDDQWKPTQAKIEALKKKGNTSLTPIIEAATLTGEMRGLELAATGEDKETSTALADLTDSAAKLMTDYLERQSKRVDEISFAANMRSSTNVTDVNISRMGLTGTQRKELEETQDTCEKLASVAELVAASAGNKATDFKTIADRAGDLGKKALDVLNADYSNSSEMNNDNRIRRGGDGQQPVRPGGGYTPR